MLKNLMEATAPTINTTSHLYYHHYYYHHYQNTTTTTAFIAIAKLKFVLSSCFISCTTKRFEVHIYCILESHVNLCHDGNASPDSHICLSVAPSYRVSCRTWEYKTDMKSEW